MDYRNTEGDSQLQKFENIQNVNQENLDNNIEEEVKTHQEKVQFPLSFKVQYPLETFSLLGSRQIYKIEYELPDGNKTQIYRKIDDVHALIEAIHK